MFIIYIVTEIINCIKMIIKLYYTEINGIKD